MTAASKSKRRRRAAIGDDARRALAGARRVGRDGNPQGLPSSPSSVPAPDKSTRGQAAAGIQSLAPASRSKRRRRAAIGDDAVDPVARSAGRDPGEAATANHGAASRARPVPRRIDGVPVDASPGARLAGDRSRGDARPREATSRRGKLRGFAPIIDRRVETLILGSFPSEASLAAGQYYAHPRNQFWRLLGGILGEPLDRLDYRARRAAVLAHRIGIWDVLGACHRTGSLDASIRAATPNDFSALRARAPGLRRVLFNGATAGRFARVFHAAGFATVVLPSSSPAHAARSFEQKLAQWRAALAAPGERPSPASGRAVETGVRPRRATARPRRGAPVRTAKATA